MRDELARQLKTATNDEVKNEIRRRSENAEGEIRCIMEKVKEYKSEAGDYEQRLGLLKKEGRFRIRAMAYG